MAKDWASTWESMSIEELFTLRELMQDVLEAKMKSRKAELERQVRTLGHLPAETRSVKGTTD
jgi:hypothetical protein